MDVLITIVISVLFLIFLYFSYWLFFTGIIGAIRMQKSKHWKPIKGKIINAEIKFMAFKDDASPTYKFTTIKTYSYTFDGKNYESNQTLAFDSLYQKEFKPMSQFPKADLELYNFQDYEKVKKDTENMIGDDITVYVNPKKPRKSCLEIKFNNEIWMPVFMGLIFGGGLTIAAIYILINALN